METLRAASPVSVGGVTLVAIERTRVRSDIGRAGCWIGAFSEAVAVVVCDAGGVRALATDSSEIDLDSLMENTPNLRAVLSTLSAG